MPIPKKIYKHRLSLSVTAQKIEVPEGSEILSTMYDGMHLQMSILCTPYTPPAEYYPKIEVREFVFLETGVEFTIDETDQLIFITTIPTLVTDIHLFEIKTIKQ